MYRFKCTIIALVLMACLANSSLGQQKYKFTNFDTPNSLFGVYDTSINDAGVVVGYYYSAEFPYTRSYAYRDGAFTSITPPAGAYTTLGFGINSSGVIPA